MRAKAPKLLNNNLKTAPNQCIKGALQRSTPKSAMIGDIPPIDLKVDGHSALEFEISRAFRPIILRKITCNPPYIFETAQVFRHIFKFALAFRFHEHSAL